MTTTDFRFLLDLMITPQEKSFISDLVENPDDASTRNAYVDYLKENGREGSADLVKDGYIPGHKYDFKETSSTIGAISSGVPIADVPRIREWI